VLSIRPFGSFILAGVGWPKRPPRDQGVRERIDVRLQHPLLWRPFFGGFSLSRLMAGESVSILRCLRAVDCQQDVHTGSGCPEPFSYRVAVAVSGSLSFTWDVVADFV
jgi:hypothetical protein